MTETHTRLASHRLQRGRKVFLYFLIALVVANAIAMTAFRSWNRPDGYINLVVAVMLILNHLALMDAEGKRKKWLVAFAFGSCIAGLAYVILVVANPHGRFR